MGNLLSCAHSLWFGLTLPLRAGALILSRPKLLLWSIIPIVLTLALYVFLLGTLHHHVAVYLTTQVTQWGLDPAGWPAALLAIFIQTLLILIGALTFSYASAIVAAPFNDFLAEAAEPWTTPALPAAPHPSVATRVRLIWIDIVKTVVASIATLAALLLSWVPVLNVVAFVLIALLMTFQFISYPQTRRGQGLSAGWAFLRRHPFASFGFGASLSLLFAIPIVFCFALPLAVVGGTMLVARYRG